MTPARTLMHDAPEMLMDLFDAVSLKAQQAGIDHDTADQIALDAVDELSECWAGQQLYFAKGVNMRLRKRDLNIYQDFTGNNHADLASKYNVSVVWVYAVIKKVKQQIESETQGSLL